MIEYVRKHGVSTLVPERKCPFPDEVMRDLFRTPDGATRGGLRVDWSSYYWRAVRACFSRAASSLYLAPVFGTPCDWHSNLICSCESES